MLATREELSRALQGTSIEDCPVQQRWYGPGLPPVFGIEVPGDDILAAWQTMHSRMDETGRYPVIALRDDFEMLHDEEPSASDIYMTEGRMKAFEEAREAVPERQASTMLFGWLSSPQDRSGHPLGKTLRRFGAAPSNAEAGLLHERGELKTDADLEKWLLQWELVRFGPRALECEQTLYLNWHHPNEYDDYVLQLVPTTDMWDAAVFSDVRMHGMRRGLSTLCRNWHQRYGAELVVSSNTMMEMVVKRRPADIHEAFELALEQRHFSSDILVLPDVSVREHARALLTLDRWFFHWKP